MFAIDIFTSQSCYYHFRNWTWNKTWCIQLFLILPSPSKMYRFFFSNLLLFCLIFLCFISALPPVGLEFSNEMFTAGSKVQEESAKSYVILIYVLQQCKCATHHNVHITSGQWVNGSKWVVVFLFFTSCICLSLIVSHCLNNIQTDLLYFLK